MVEGGRIWTPRRTVSKGRNPMAFITINGRSPADHGAAFVAENATLAGCVRLAKESSVWYGAVLRADTGCITIGENTNVQDNAVLHTGPGLDVKVGKGVSIGHGAIVHGCTVGDHCLIGMHATLLNHCVVGKNCIIGAGALVPEGMVIPDNSVAVGVPARVIKTIRDDQLAHNIENAEAYVEMGRQHAALVSDAEN